jgi:Ca-activated chloride channel family protein
MLADDIQPSRYAVAKQNIISILKKMATDRFALFVFTANPLLISPPSSDTDIAISALEAINPEFILTKSTSIKNLLKGVAKFEKPTKELIIFTDGGEEKDINTLVQLARKGGIKVDIVAVGSKKGAVLKKDAKALVDTNNQLVISRINPMIKILADATGGFYVPLTAPTDISDILVEKMQEQKTDMVQADIQSYVELYYIPLFLAFVILLVVHTKLLTHVKFFVVFLVLLPNLHVRADDGFDAYKQGKYKQAAEYFEMLSPSKESFYNAGVAYYKAGLYKKALDLFASIKTSDKALKEKIFYNMANCAVKLKHYDRAKVLYKKALYLDPNDIQAKENLLQLYALQLKEKQDVADMMPHINDKQSTTLSKNNETKNDTQKSGSKKKKNTNRQNSTTANAGAGGEKRQLSHQKKNTQLYQKNQEYKFGYSAYELINKGYINETHPW